MNVSISHPTNRPNFSVVHVGPLVLYFSYQTVIAFIAPGTGRVVRQNDWGPTSGKHINEVDGGGSVARSERVSSSVFDEALSEVLAGLDPTTVINNVVTSNA